MQKGQPYILQVFYIITTTYISILVHNGIQDHCQASPIVAQEVPISPDLHLPPPPRLTDMQSYYPSQQQQSNSNQGQLNADVSVPMEVPVIIESRHSVFHSKGEKNSCSPFEIRYMYFI